MTEKIAKRNKEKIVRTFKKWIVKRRKFIEWACAISVAFGGLVGAAAFSLSVGRVYDPMSHHMAVTAAFICASVLALPMLGAVWLKFVEKCVMNGEKLCDTGYDSDGDSGGPCNGSGGSSCSGNAKCGTKIGTALTSVIADLAINCRKLAPVGNGGCAKPCADCRCKRELGANSTQSEGTADADAQLKRAVNESILDILGRLSEARFVTESIDSLVAKLAEIAFPNENSPALSLVCCGGGTYGRSGGVYG